MNLFAKYLIRIPVRFFWPNYTNTASYQSAISLQNLYPNSNLKLTTPQYPEIEKGLKFSGFIPVEELEISYHKSSGPGGQNVNKVNTKVEIRFKIESAKWISDEIRTKLADKMRHRITKDGYLIFKSDLTRSQLLNQADCMEKIRATIRSCCIKNPEPDPDNIEIQRKRMEKAARERLAFKRERSYTKMERRDPN